jgi:hypothetical protein
MDQPKECEKNCVCDLLRRDTRFIVLTGGPGAGKTAVLELIRKMLCEHIAILPEAASIVFGGGFWRMDSLSGRLSAQKAIFHVQREMENLVRAEERWAMALCDRGTLDGLAYWPEGEASFWALTGTSLKEEYDHYLSVIHLRSPSEAHGYNKRNPLRIESARQAEEIDNRIATVWSKHPKYRSIGSSPDFISKARQAVELIVNDLPACCRFTPTKGLASLESEKALR